MIQKYDPRNRDIKIWVGDRLFHRNDARVSVFDSSVQGGDAVWEGLRVYENGILHLDRHLDRLFDSAHALAFMNVPKRDEVRSAIRATLDANKMDKDTHIRLTLTRGEKVTSSMDPRVNESGCTIIVLAEWKPIVFDNEKGITAITSTIRRNPPQVLDSKIHHNNLLNNIQAKIQAIVAGVDSALMLDMDGFAAEFHDVNLFAIRNGVLHTPYADACLPGITRNFVLELARKNDIPWSESRLSLTDLYTSDGLFATGTMGELTPVMSLDGREIKNPLHNNVFQRLKQSYIKSIPESCQQP